MLLGLIVSARTLAQTIPETPLPSLPSNAAINQSVNVTFSWAATAHAVKYRLQVASVTSFSDSSVILDTAIADNGLLTITFTSDSLKYSTKYYWRLNASSADSTSAWSTVYNFTTVIAPPATPVETLPLPYAHSIALSSSAKWNAVANATTYQVQVDTSTLFAAPAINDSTLTTTTKVLSLLLNYKRYYWRVRAKNIGGASVWSSAQTFLTELSQPTLLAPASATVNQSISPVLKWNANANALLYSLQVSTSSTFATLVLSDSLITDTVRTIGPFNNSTTYYWHVLAKNDSCTSQYQTTAFSFTTIAAAPAN
ncbi:MAG TPA: hypothetical protein VMU30_11970, partial [Bacteroidota bacterium]|nr:hypothetical protein [Bacteroidota bacterium]